MSYNYPDKWTTCSNSDLIKWWRKEGGHTCVLKGMRFCQVEKATTETTMPMITTKTTTKPGNLFGLSFVSTFNFLYHKIFGKQHFLGPKIYKDPKFVRSNNFFGPKNCFSQKYVMTKNLFGPKNCLDPKFLDL